LARSERFRFPKGGQAGYKFGEFHAGLWLERAGFTCWTGVQLFDHPKPRKGFWQKNTDEVRALWNVHKHGCQWPGDICASLRFQPRTPDLVAYHPRKGWRFCEVKRVNDRVTPEQLKALAILHLLTNAPVAIVRVVPRGARVRREPYEVTLKYTGQRAPDWARSRPVVRS
jgi:hypothetical protein